MKTTLILLLLLFVPFTTKAKEEESFLAISDHSFRQQEFENGLSRDEAKKPSSASVAKEFFKAIRKNNPPIDKFAYWLGENLGSFVPAGVISLKKDQEISHKKINVNILNEGNGEKKIQEAQKKNTLLFEYALTPRVHLDRSPGFRLSFKRSFGKFHLTWENELDKKRHKDQNKKEYVASSILVAKFNF